MATLELPLLPLHLYRYRSLSKRANSLAQEIASIKQGYLYCADLEKMNDPMEGFYRPSSKLKRKQTYQQIADEVYARKHDLGMACFSENHKNELMWAHYADNYTGICIGYNARRLAAALGVGLGAVIDQRVAPKSTLL